MRPPGEIRQALRGAAEMGAGTWRELAERAQVGYADARNTVKNMARAGELVEVGRVKPAGANNWMCLFEVPDMPDAPDAPKTAGVTDEGAAADEGMQVAVQVLSLWPGSRGPGRPP